MAAQWDALIEGSYRVLEEAQCGPSGLITNWCVPSPAPHCMLTSTRSHANETCGPSGLIQIGGDVPSRRSEPQSHPQPQPPTLTSPPTPTQSRWVPSDAAALAEVAPWETKAAAEQWPGWAAGGPHCSGSGTPAAEFGAEAARVVWCAPITH